MQIFSNIVFITNLFTLLLLYSFAPLNFIIYFSHAIFVGFV